MTKCNLHIVYAKCHLEQVAGQCPRCDQEREKDKGKQRHNTLTILTLDGKTILHMVRPSSPYHVWVYYLKDVLPSRCKVTSRTKPLMQPRMREIEHKQVEHTD